MTWRLWSRRAAWGSKGAASALVGLAIVVAATMTAVPADAGIKDTKHNLGASGTGVNHLTTGVDPLGATIPAATTEICVFCHTPHGADTSAAVPLWNRNITTVPIYQLYDSLGTSSLDGKVAPVGSVSIACLSCHDGTQAMSTVLNAPGSGTAWSTTPVWTGANQDGTGKLKTGIITNIGTDLRNDHPVGIQYGGGGLTATTPAAATNDKDFKQATGTNLGLQSQVLNGTRVWWVDTELTPNGTRQKTDMILYTRAKTAGYTGQTDAEPFVECASCHDPHTSDNATFLRISNANSAVCLACHVK